MAAPKNQVVLYRLKGSVDANLDDIAVIQQKIEMRRQSTVGDKLVKCRRAIGGGKFDYVPAPIELYVRLHGAQLYLGKSVMNGGALRKYLRNHRINFGLSGSDKSGIVSIFLAKNVAFDNHLFICLEEWENVYPGYWLPNRFPGILNKQRENGLDGAPLGNQYGLGGPGNRTSRGAPPKGSKNALGNRGNPNSKGAMFIKPVDIGKYRNKYCKSDLFVNGKGREYYVNAGGNRQYPKSKDASQYEYKKDYIPFKDSIQSRVKYFNLHKERSWTRF